MGTIQQYALPLNTLADGSLTRDVRLGVCQLLAVEIELGDLDTPDVTLTDEPAGVTLLAVTGLSAGAVYQPSVQAQKSDGTNLTGAFAPALVTGRIHVVVAGGGNKKTGNLILTYQR